MEATADQIYAQYGDTLVTIVLNTNEEFVARIVRVVGGLSVRYQPTIPDSKFLELHRYHARKPFTRPNLTYDHIVLTIHPEEISEIEKYTPQPQ